METEKKKNQRTKLSIYILDTIESESTTRFKNRSSDRMMTSDWLVDVSDDRYTTSNYYSVFNKSRKTKLKIKSCIMSRERVISPFKCSLLKSLSVTNQNQIKIFINQSRALDKLNYKYTYKGERVVWLIDRHNNTIVK